MAMEPNFPSAPLCANLKHKKKVTDFSIKAIMAERDELIREVRGEKLTAFRKVKSPTSPKTRDSITPLSMSETPDTTTADDVLPLTNTLKEKPCSPELANVQCHLEVKELWERFNELGTEMIITRSGRRMFPTIRASFSGLDSKASYMILMDIVTVDNKRYRYAYHRSSWLVAGKGDPAHHTKLYPHPDSPFLGEQLRKQIITFEKVKLTNTEVHKPGYIVLNSMHRYQPRIHLVQMRGDTDLAKTLKTYDDLQSCIHKTFVFPECSFYSVTAYQNQLITKLKIDCNPFAKGFRDSTRVITDMERDSFNNSGMLPDSTVFPYANCTMSPSEPISELDAAIFSQKLAHFSRMMPGAMSDSQSLPMYGGMKPFPLPPTSIPLGILQKWSLAGLNAGLPMGGNFDQRSLFNTPADLARQLLFGKPIPIGPFYPFIGMDNQEMAQKLKENGNF